MKRLRLAIAVLAAALFVLAAPAPAAVPDAVTVDGGRYYGPLVDGKLHGRGRLEWENGARYEGEFANGLASGRGRFQFANGHVYEGEFRDGLMAGKGRYEIPGREVYEGEFKQDYYWGRGQVTYEDGRKYRGDFVRGDYHGKGRHEGSLGEVYEGDFERNDFTGAGVYTTKEGIRYEGAFRKWRFHGLGRYSDASGNHYEGTFVDGQLDGSGKLANKSYGTYEGEFKQWRFHGQGVLRLANGDVYKGSFARGLYEGDGTLTYAKPRPDGRTQDSGVWRYGSLPNDAERSKAWGELEAALYTQRALLDKSIAALEPRRPGRINMYLLAVAGDGMQEVFRREVEFVQEQFARRFDTRGHSIALVNSRSTRMSAPMATATSLREALKAIAARMDRNEDILFLFLTSHGSRDHEFSLTQIGMELRGLRAAQLAELLKESGIRWKVVVISACYSGGFVDPIKDDSTLVIAAARRDRQSFGCADENDFTYFGRAFFKEALPQSRSFQEAFRRAEALVGDWERKDAKDAAAKDDKAAEEARSLPQMSNPGPIGQHLQRWWAQVPKQP